VPHAPTVQTTQGCKLTIRLLVALEEAGMAYQVETVEDGHFRGRYGVPGPVLVEDGYVVVEPNAVLRHVGRAYGGMPADLRGQAEVDRWLELQMRVPRAAGDGPDKVRQLLALLDARLDGHTWLAGDFTVADCGLATLARVPAGRLPLDGLVALNRTLDALRARPAFARAAARVVA
jgi:glutathione S-transferase